MIIKAFLAGFSALLLFTAFGGSQPYVPAQGFFVGTFVFFVAALSVLLTYFVFFYRQKDKTWKYGWKLIRKERHKFKASSIISLPTAIVLLGYFLTMPAEVALGVGANILNEKRIVQYGKCITSYQNRLRGPVSEIELEGKEMIKLYGFDYLCGNRVGAPIQNAMSNVQLTGRQSWIGVWIDHIAPIR
jgi:hypothetical protein